MFRAVGLHLDAAKARDGLATFHRLLVEEIEGQATPRLGRQVQAHRDGDQSELDGTAPHRSCQGISPSVRVSWRPLRAIASRIEDSRVAQAWPRDPVGFPPDPMRRACPYVPALSHPDQWDPRVATHPDVAGYACPACSARFGALADHRPMDLGSGTHGVHRCLDPGRPGGRGIDHVLHPSAQYPGHDWLTGNRNPGHPRDRRWAQRHAQGPDRHAQGRAGRPRPLGVMRERECRHARERGRHAQGGPASRARAGGSRALSSPECVVDPRSPASLASC